MPDILPFDRPATGGEDDITAVADVLRSGWITTGRSLGKDQWWHYLVLKRQASSVV